MYLPGRAEGLRWSPLSGIGMPDSGTEPIHQEHVMCSRFRGSCPSDVKSAVHPEFGISIPLSGDTAALCAPREIQKNPAARSVPGYRSRIPPAVPSPKQRACEAPGRALSECGSPVPNRNGHVPRSPLSKNPYKTAKIDTKIVIVK